MFCVRVWGISRNVKRSYIRSKNNNDVDGSSYNLVCGCVSFCNFCYFLIFWIWFIGL